MVNLSSILQNIEKIKKIAEVIGFKNVCIIKSPAINQINEFCLLVNIDYNNSIAERSNRVILASILEKNLKCSVNIIVEDGLPQYNVIPLQASAIPLELENIDKICKLFGGDIAFNEPDLSDLDEAEVYYQEQETFNNIYQEMQMREKVGSFNHQDRDLQAEIDTLLRQIATTLVLDSPTCTSEIKQDQDSSKRQSPKVY